MTPCDRRDPEKGLRLLTIYLESPTIHECNHPNGCNLIHHWSMMPSSYSTKRFFPVHRTSGSSIIITEETQTTSIYSTQLRFFLSFFFISFVKPSQYIEHVVHQKCSRWLVLEPENLQVGPTKMSDFTLILTTYHNLSRTNVKNCWQVLKIDIEELSHIIFYKEQMTFF